MQELLAAIQQRERTIQALEAEKDSLSMAVKKLEEAKAGMFVCESIMHDSDGLPPSVVNQWAETSLNEERRRSQSLQQEVEALSSRLREISNLKDTITSLESERSSLASSLEDVRSSQFIAYLALTMCPH